VTWTVSEAPACGGSQDAIRFLPRGAGGGIMVLCCLLLRIFVLFPRRFIFMKSIHVWFRCGVTVKMVHKTRNASFILLCNAFFFIDTIWSFIDN